jgi:hypothetical protein
MDPVTKMGKAVHNIKIKISDPCLAFTEYDFAVEVSNTAPVFKTGFTISDAIIPMNTVYKIPLSTSINDIDGDTILVLAYVIINGGEAMPPSMITVVAPQTIVIEPKLFAELGTYTVRAYIYDFWPYNSWLDF